MQELSNVANGHRFRRGARVVFVDNFFCSRAERSISVDVVPHLGLMTLATLLERAGHGVELLDPKILFTAGNWRVPDHEFLDACAADLLGRNADVIGFTAYGRTLPFVIRVSERIKSVRPQQKIILGGPHATIVGKAVLERFPCFDAVARYEAEPIICDLIAALLEDRDLEGIPNLVVRHGDAVLETPRSTALVEMDDVPEPALQLYPIDQLRMTELSIEAGRGCPYQCTFCSTSTFFQRRYRLKSNERMIREMCEARDRYGVRMFNLNHDLFGLVKKSLREFCALVRDLSFAWKCSMRTDTLDTALAAELAQAGCRHIYFGVESGSPRMQKIIKKHLDLARTPLIIRDVVACGMHCTTSFISGFPEETEDDQDQTLDCVGALLAVDPQRVHPQLHVLSPEPGSDLSSGSTPIFFDGLGPEVDEYIDEELVAAHPDLFSVFYHYPSETQRSRTIYASAFVTHVMPQLGYPLATHIFTNFFGGSLAKLFRGVIAGAPDAPPDFEQLMLNLWAGLDRVVDSLANEAPYLQDAVRLSRIMHGIRRSSTATPRSTPENGSAGGAWLARFDHDIESVARAIMKNPATPMSASELARTERWYVLQCASEENLIIANIAPELGRELQEMSTPKWFENSKPALKELGAAFIEC